MRYALVYDMDEIGYLVVHSFYMTMDEAIDAGMYYFSEVFEVSWTVMEI